MKSKSKSKQKERVFAKSKKGPLPIINRDISWLSFNDRVLQEANKKNNPLLERLKFLGIVSSNRDEFYRVRVASIKRIIRLGKRAADVLGEDPISLLEKIQGIAIRQQEQFDSSWKTLLRDLRSQGISFLNERNLSTEQARYVKGFFREKVLPGLTPILLDNVEGFPVLNDRNIYFLVVMKREKQKDRYALLEIPTGTISRFLVLPKSNKQILFLDDVIRFCLHDIFFQFHYDSISAYTIKLTRDAELDLEQDVTKSIVKKVAEGVKRRSKGLPTRLVHDEELPPNALSYLVRRMRLGGHLQVIPGGRYHNFIDFIRFPDLGRADLLIKLPPPVEHPSLPEHTSVFKVVREKDVLLSFPYHGFNHILDFLREASIDPKVERIQITLYRLSTQSQIVSTLINAIRNGKEVQVVIELQARFDEENNIRLTNRLNEEGAQIIYGVPGLKMHSKLFLITRRENNRHVFYAHVGTGNFNEETAKFYCDHSLLTGDKRVTDEVSKVFQFYQNNFKIGPFRHLIVSPFDTRKKLVHLIEREISNAAAGKEAWIFLKMNSLTDPGIIAKLYEAGAAGVQVRLVVRSICSLIPGIEGLSEQIQAISIVDKYLEHSRIYMFGNGGSPSIYLASFDLMQRNIDFRSEVAVPIYDKQIRKTLRDMMEIQWSDNVNARIIDAGQQNRFRNPGSGLKHRAQDELYRYLSASNKQKAKGKTL